MWNQISNVFQQVQAGIEEKLEKFQQPSEGEQQNSSEDRSTSPGSSDLRQPHASVDDKSWEKVQPELNEEQKLAIRKSWSILRHEIKSIGVLTFLQLFEQKPEAKNQFKHFQHMTHRDLHMDETFHNHATRVMRVIEKVVDNLDEPANYKSYLTILGQKHVMYEVDPNLLDEMGLVFLNVVEPMLTKEDCWDDLMRDSWDQLIVMTIFYMRSAMKEASR